MTYQIHIISIVALALIILTNIAVIFIQKDNRKLRKYLRIQASAWSTVLSMVIFTGMVFMALAHMGFTIKIIAMIAATLAIITLEVRRHIDLKRAQPDSECFDKFRKRALRYYTFQILWIAMVGGISPKLS